MKNLSLASLAFIAGLALIQSCKPFENDVNITLDPYEKQLFVECYLEPGQPYRLLLSETQGYFEDFNTLPFIQGATVVIEHNGVRDTLQSAMELPGSQFPFFPYLNDTGTRFYNYQSPTICPVDYNNDFSLFIIDSLGRTITGTTRMIPPVLIDSLVYDFDQDSMAYLLMKFQDDGNTANYYRPILRGIRDTKDSARTLDFSVDDSRFLNGEYVVFGTNRSYFPRDTAIGTLFHIDKPYYDFLESINNAITSNGNPFSTPARIKSTVQGGMGVFTFLSYDTRQVILN